MKLTYKIAIRLCILLLPIIALWAVIFYYSISAEINDETDDALERYAEMIMTRKLAGQELPSADDAIDNSYSLTAVSMEYANASPHIQFENTDVYIPLKMETEPARVLTTIFRDSEGIYYELKVATHTFEKNDLIQTISSMAAVLYLLLMASIVIISIFVLNKSMKPLYALLNWLDNYKIGKRNMPFPEETSITEFQKLNRATKSAMERSEELYEEQKQFIGNASHELQTPLAVLSGRIEWILNNYELDEACMGELMEMKQTIANTVKLNKNLLMLSKIENRQVPEANEMDLIPVIRQQASLFDEIYETEGKKCKPINVPEHFMVKINDSMASVMIGNLIKNAFVHSGNNSFIEVGLEDNCLMVKNRGDMPLDRKRVFERFYQAGHKEGSNGLGLAIVKAIAEAYHFEVDYDFEDGLHIFCIFF